jgi:hypothetical protein
MRRAFMSLLVVLSLDTAVALAADPQYLNQNWSETDRQWFYTTPQESKLIPLLLGLGVFADIKIRKPKFLHWYYESTAKRINLLEIEDRLAQLRSPQGSENDLRNDLLSNTHQTLSKTHAASDTGTNDPVKLDLKQALQAIEQTRAASPSTGLAYKARPLDGIWATAPYLHNGSVPTLRALLAAPASRPKTFYAGSRDFDPVNAGFDTAARPDRFLFDTSLLGNSNAGHDYGTSLTNGDLDALLVYLKSL